METSCGDLTTVEIELNGVRVRGRYRVMGKTVVVYFDEKIKFVDYGMDRPETVAKWLLSDLSRAKPRKQRMW
ncbi:hypothetical protein AWB81_07499 [Caballeronia arationis]|jgi:hypothetical protein|nr:hypothetical protein AWB81_07499 [Caballeronia arationis]